MNTALNNVITRNACRARVLSPALLAAAGMAVSAPALQAQDREHYEWEPGTGSHEEEWYDPSDWFDDDSGFRGVDYEEYGPGQYDPGDYDYYNDDYYEYDEDDYYAYEDDYYDDDYEWEPGTGSHEEEWYDPTDWFDDDYAKPDRAHEQLGARPAADDGQRPAAGPPASDAAAPGPAAPGPAAPDAQP